jgi:hypothetical protein
MKGANAYSARPQEEVCQAAYPGCTLIPTTRIYCRTEGRSVLSCLPCHQAWRNKVHASASETFRLELRCPCCAEWHPEGAGPSRTVTEVLHEPLTGAVAQAIDTAMHAEGLLHDVRIKVLSRLAKDAPWLAFAEPPPSGLAPSNTTGNSVMIVPL